MVGFCWQSAGLSCMRPQAGLLAPFMVVNGCNPRTQGTGVESQPLRHRVFEVSMVTGDSVSVSLKRRDGREVCLGWGVAQLV